MGLRAIKWVVYINPMYLECLSETLRLGYALIKYLDSKFRHNLKPKTYYLKPTTTSPIQSKSSPFVHFGLLPILCH